MPRYFFDHYENGERFPDDEGMEFDSPAQVRAEAMRTLPAIAKDEIAKDGDRQAYTVLVRNEAGEAVYSATLTFVGLWLSGDSSL